MVVHCPRAGAVLVTPNFMERLIPRDDALGVLCEELQRLKFLWSNCDLLAATSDLGLGKIHYHVRKDIHICVLRTGARRAPDQRTQTRNKFPWAERYGHVVVGTHFQQKDLVRNL